MKKQLWTWLQELGIKTKLFSHPPVFTVDQAKHVTSSLNIPGAQCKNLFLKDRKKQVWLLVALADRKIELKKLAKALNAPELRFASPDLLHHYLGVEAGSVTPFGLINDKHHEVRVVIDEELLGRDLLGFHPLTNDATVTISPFDLQKFISSCNNKLIIHQFKNSD